MVARSDPEHRPKGLAHRVGLGVAFAVMAFISVLVLRILWFGAGRILGFE